ncbi:MAG: ExeM/NucH family extracellular endonuclease [Chloroflexi bacterium]|nr:ExeM/NucH family extracellular endonuclease [Chloroflexota bacterium]
MRFLLTCTAALAAVWLLLANLHVAPVTAASPQGGSVVINEVEADSPGTDTAEFLELYFTNGISTSLDGYVLVFYNGSNDLSYLAFDLDGQSTDADGYFVLCGNAANTPNCDLDVLPNTDLIQNGQDAIALYNANAADFPLNTPVTLVNIVDAIVYDTNDVDDAGLLVLLNASQPQVNEGSVNSAEDSNQRCPNGTGGLRNTDTYAQYPPTPGTVNVCGGPPVPSVVSTTPTNGATNVPVASTVGVTFNEPVTVTANWFDLTCTTGGTITTTHSATPATSYTITPSVALDYGDTCVGTVFAAEVSNSNSLTMTADVTFTFSTAPLTADVTFVYNDLEGVVAMSETVWLAGAFNGWTPVQMNDAGAGVYTYTITGLIPSTSYEYKYIVDDGSPQWDWLNTNNRSISVVGTATQQDYRHVVPGWANLDSPASMTGTVGTASDNVLGQLFINNVTNPTGEGRGLQAQVGYGNSTNPASWSWFGMDFNAQLGNNDQFQGVITPTLGGVFSYTTRYNGNWGTGNPNSAWYYGDLDGNVAGGGFSLDQTGVISVAGPTLPDVIINELDADSPGTDAAEFIELYDGGAGNTPLDGLVVVLYNGSNDLSYQAFDLDGQTTDGNGYFVLCGNAANVPNCDLDVTPDTDLIQNGQDAAALYQASATDFPVGSAVTTANLVDAIVYDTADADDPALLVLLNAGQPQVNESNNGTPADDSNQRCPNGTGGARNTATYEQHAPSAGTENLCGEGIDLALAAAITPVITDEGETITVTLTLNNDASATMTATGVVVNAYLPDTATEIDNVSNSCGATAAGNTLTWTVGSLNVGVNVSCTINATVRVGTTGTTLTFDAEVEAANEQDLDSTPGNMSGAPAEDDEARATADVGVPAACAVAPTHLIHQVQGSGDASPIVGNVVTVQAVVVSNFQATLNGFHIQEEVADQDSNPATSEGIFIFNSTPVSVGDLVRVTGTVAEFSGLTELTGATVTLCSQGNAIAPTLVTLPLASGGTWEPYEGMLIEVQDLVVTDNFRLGRFGQIRLATHLLAQPTNVVAPGAPANALQDLNNRSYITLDDGRAIQNPDPMIYPAPELSYTNTLRGGDAVGQVIGVIDHFNTDSADDYRLQPTQPVSITAVNVRQETVPAVGGTIQVASFNVLNYFSTLDDGTNDICGPLANQECRGADSALEFQRQYTKIVNAIVEIDAAVVGLMEIENNATDNAVIDLVTRLNAVAGAGVYDYVDTGVIGTDAIKQALIYQPALVTPVGAYAILDNSVDSRFDDTKNRPVIIQTFEENSSGERFTVAVNHLKSKGSACTDVGDPDTGDGQGNCNVTRTNAAEALVDYLATDPTGSGSAYSLIIGDLNSYAQEDPIMAIDAAGYTNLISYFGGVNAYGYQFDGQWGYLDHGLASDELLPFVTDAVEWHINADEPIVFDYNVEFKTANQINIFYSPSGFRSSDHDPVIIGLDFNPTITPTIAIETPNNGDVFTVTVGNTTVDVPMTITTTNFAIPTDGHWHLSINGANQGPVMGYTTTVPLAAGSYTLTAELYTPDHTPLGVMASVVIEVVDEIAPPTPTVSIVTPENGDVFTVTLGNTTADVPLTITTTNFTIPTDGHWHWFLDGVDQGPVMDYSTTLALPVGEHEITVELHAPDHTPLGITATVTVIVVAETEPPTYTIFLPLIMKP